MTTILVVHDRGCPFTGLGHTDAAKRIFDTYHLHRTADMWNAIGKWYASALADGTSDNVLYDTKGEAIRHQRHNENYYTYIQISQANMTVCNAEVMLTVSRKLYEKGWRISDPSVARRDPIKRMNTEDMVDLMRGMPGNFKITRSN